MRCSAHTGETISLHDVANGSCAHLLTALQDRQRSAFPEYPFVSEEIARLAQPHRERPGQVAHQWLLQVDGVPAGHLLSATNSVRRFTAIQFLSLDRAVSRLWVDGRRITDWFIRHSLTQYRSDTGDAGLGCLGEVYDHQLALFRRWGWLRLPCDYLEPVHGWNWMTDGLETRARHLIWLPAPGVDAEAMIERVVPSATATFLLDVYALDPALPWVADLVRDAAMHVVQPR